MDSPLWGVEGQTPSQLVAQGLSLVPHGTQLFHQQRDDEEDTARRLQETNNSQLRTTARAEKKVDYIIINYIIISMYNTRDHLFTQYLYS